MSGVVEKLGHRGPGLTSASPHVGNAGLWGLNEFFNRDKLPFDRDQPPLTPDEKEMNRRFHDLYYRRWL